ncbi:PepSY domain-containing protein [Luteimonas sp. BDR2-5]|uniref:PepSY domain-containing protein n=1 Tax=Proluteimonas luteida TaxID=2878685 RepID=UPI001E323D51|nr:PepSY domain-containing protein [Luteimonas sp. BDR2-5]MCD9028350.1 PepSY domain-containing protein [Luteimonas sp. BDR2-5]
MRPSLVLSAFVLLACVSAVPVSGAEGPARRGGDADYARDGVRRGTLVRLEQLLADAERRYPGRVIEVELDDDDDEYEIEILMRDGRVVELTYDARTGRLLEVEIDD